MCHCHTNTVPPRMWEAWTVTGNSAVTEPRTKSWHWSKPLSVANIKLTGLCKVCTQSLSNFEVFCNSRNYADPHWHLERPGLNAILAFLL